MNFAGLRGNIPSRRLFRRTIPIGLLASLAILSASALRGESSSQPAPRVTMDAGILEGKHFSANPTEVAFLGIPDAAAPVGELRWQPPHPPPAWPGVRSAKSFGPACPQLPSGWLPEMLGRRQMETDEACLYLNVWTTNLPAASAPASTRRQPVMVWIDGGGNVEGSQEWPPLGPALARRGVVVVSINYRLGVFGFLSLHGLSAESPQHASGNYGLLDQMEALRWVRRNIDKFGGDPANVTVFGASSGSLDICDMMASPLATGLYQKAILQSGFCVDSDSPTLEQAEDQGKILARQFGVSGDDAPSIESLRAVPADRLLRQAATDGEIDFNPVVDRWALLDQPSRIFAQGKQERVPVLLGSNRDEVSIFASPLVGGNSYRPKTVAAYRQWLEKTFHDLASEVFSAYPAHSDAEVPPAFLAMETAHDFGFGAWLMARETQAAGQNAFLYNFTYTGSGQFASLGAFHSEESILLSKRYWASWTANPDDERMSETLIGYWTQFARTSHPGGPGLPAWPAYNAKTDRYQELGRHTGQIPSRSSRMRVFKKTMNAP